jgi:TPR repeat protein
MYDNGEGVKQDYAEAVKWYRKAAEQGEASAQFYLGLMYAKGQGVKQDYAEAVKWYRKAAEQGEAIAQFNLGVKYHRGEGLTKNLLAAYAWYTIAAANGNTVGATWKANTAKQLSPAQLTQAEAYAKELIAKNPKLIK